MVFSLAATAAAQSPLAGNAAGPSKRPVPVRTIEQRLSDPVYMSWVARPEVSACLQCHLEGPGLGVIASGQSGLTAFSRRQEMEAWISLDKHTIARRRVEPFNAADQEKELLALLDDLESRAAQTIETYRQRGIQLDESKVGLTEIPDGWLGESQVLSRRICDKLWGEGHVTTPAGYETFTRQCLTCHGGVDPDAAFATNDSKPIGIDCLFCHQNNASPTWITQHTDVKSWRLLPPDQKAAAGMTDLANTATQASMCLDCHVGNQSKGMFVTHAMYAAGHPPLPPVDVQTFCDEMPQHWQTPGQLYDNLVDDPTRTPFFQINYPGVTDEVAGDAIYWNTRKVLVGALEARKSTLRMYVDAANGDHWGDYAMYDCASCHHELRRDSLRQRHYLTSSRPLTPGRPRPADWPSVVLPVAYSLATSSQQQRINDAERRWIRGFDETPFGGRDLAASSASGLIEQIDELVQAISHQTIDHDTAIATLQRLTQTAPRELVNYDASRQLIWTILAIAGEVQSHRNDSFSAETQRLLGHLRDPAVAGIDLHLPAGRQETIYPNNLRQQLQRQADYDPAGLLTLLAQLDFES